ncbi:hypothetical protein NQ317_015510 [Molorchus minor]|uniref:Protein kinase domain-containing protein n=1 Tax=Molorchus minor TaxID=1323400 RepID=A0ABQ9JKR8_9CUCU|nr:hypothetical protein NQ317_015510 [Molorchus minor]
MDEIVLPVLSPSSNLVDDDNVKKNDDALKCLNIIEKIAYLLKYENNDFMDIIENLLAIAEDNQHRDSRYRNKKIELITTIISNLQDADTDELEQVKQEFKTVTYKFILDTSEVNKANWVNYVHIMFCCILVMYSEPIKNISSGQGAFGVVIQGSLKRSGKLPKSVAIKVSREFRYNKLIPYEGFILSKLNNENIVKFYAINKSATRIAIELMDFGNLNAAVEEVRFSKQNLLKILIDISSGMDYLCKQKFLHRDLACRNVFLNARKQCKIGDFGMTVYVGNTNGEYLETEYEPQDNNVSPETLRTKLFTRENDVWAMGILAWELFYISEHTNEFPPASFSMNIHLKRFQIFDELLPKAVRCPRKLHIYITRSLLNESPSQRPTFSAIKAKLKEMMTDND